VHPVAAVTVEGYALFNVHINLYIDRQKVVYILSIDPLSIVQKITTQCVPSDLRFDDRGTHSFISILIVIWTGRLWVVGPDPLVSIYAPDANGSQFNPIVDACCQAVNSHPVATIAKNTESPAFKWLQTRRSEKQQPANSAANAAGSESEAD